MSKLLNLVIVGCLAAGIMIIAELLLTKLSIPGYPGLYLVGEAGLRRLGYSFGMGAVFGIVYGILIRPILPSGRMMAALIFSLIPFITLTMVLPLWRGGAVPSGNWHLVFTELSLFIYSLALVTLGKGGGSSSKE